MTKKKPTPEEAYENLVNFLQEIFEEHNISAILKVPYLDVLSFYQNRGDKLQIWEYVDIEQRLNEEKIQTIIDNELYNTETRLNNLEPQQLPLSTKTKKKTKHSTKNKSPTYTK